MTQGQLPLLAARSTEAAVTSTPRVDRARSQPTQLQRVLSVLHGSRFWTWHEIQQRIRWQYDAYYGEASIRARWSDLRLKCGWAGESRRRGGKGNLWEYRINGRTHHDTTS